MSNAMGMSTISDLFSDVYGAGIPGSARQAWIDTFQHIRNEDIESAARWIIAHRQKSGKVVPGEVWHALQMIDVVPDKFYESAEFRADPVHIALDSHYRAMCKLPGITLAAWLEEEGLTWREAMDKYGDRPSSAELLQQIVAPKNEAPF